MKSTNIFIGLLICLFMIGAIQRESSDQTGIRMVNESSDTLTISPTLIYLNTGTVNTYRQKLQNIYHAFGGFEDSATVITITTQNLWYHITDTEGDLFGGLEADGMMLYGDTMVINNTGDYSGIVSLTFSALNTKDFQVRLYNVTQTKQEGFHIGLTATGSTNFANLALPLYAEATAGDSLVLQIRNTSDSADPTFKSGMFFLQYLHE